jgi:hypothetical protein
VRARAGTGHGLPLAQGTVKRRAAQLPFSSPVCAQLSRPLLAGVMEYAQDRTFGPMPLRGGHIVGERLRTGQSSETCRNGRQLPEPATGIHRRA